MQEKNLKGEGRERESKHTIDAKSQSKKIQRERGDRERTNIQSMQTHKEKYKG